MGTSVKPKIQRADERAFFDHGWLRTFHSFSFAEYYDPANANWGALRVFNDDVIAPGKGFGTHPHRDMEILTYVLAGKLAHRDSMGNERIVEPGAVQYLSAGTGITHAEYNASETEPLRLVQMWVTPRQKGLHPQYGQVDYTLQQRRDRWLPIASGVPEVASPITIFQDAAAYVARLESVELTHRVKAGRLAFLFVADGCVRMADEELSSGDAVRFSGDTAISVTGSGELVLWDVPEA
jgi:redox-sensitive bicupin YhaK (pirin superfamily)